MIGLSRRVRVFAYTRPVDMRKQYDGLYALVVAEMKGDPLSGDLFLFTNRRRTRAKVLLWGDHFLHTTIGAGLVQVRLKKSSHLHQLCNEYLLSGFVKCADRGLMEGGAK